MGQSSRTFAADQRSCVCLWRSATDSALRLLTVFTVLSLLFQSSDPALALQANNSCPSKTALIPSRTAFALEAPFCSFTMDPPQQPQQAQLSQYQQQQQYYQYQPGMEGNKLPPPHVSPRNMWLSKVIFRILSAIFSIVIIGLSAYIGTKWSSAGYDAGPLVIMLPPACVGLIWDLGELVAVLVRGGHRGTHPGAVVALDLVLWLGFIVAVVFYGLYYLGDIYYYGSYWYEYESLSDIGETIIMSRVILALGSIEVAIHLLLFIFGCYETSIRNRTTSASTAPTHRGSPSCCLSAKRLPLATWHTHTDLMMTVPASSTTRRLSLVCHRSPRPSTRPPRRCMATGGTRTNRPRRRVSPTSAHKYCKIGAL